jgi:exopolyphosphatase/guanosine-5'-triphosphate,3'-diphosphate pyrophosphatase
MFYILPIFYRISLSFMILHIYTIDSQAPREYNSPKKMDTPGVIGFIDIGTNSTRLLIIRKLEEGSWETLFRHKTAVRLGEREFDSHFLIPEAIERTTATIVRYADIARKYNAQDIIAVATSATREAENREEFIARIKEQSGVEIRVIPGEEEARLIWKGVSGEVHPGLERTLFIDIGGGSTELIIGDEWKPAFLCSLPLGAIRLSNRFFSEDEHNAVPYQIISELCTYIDVIVTGISRELLANPSTRAYGSSGTIIALELIARNHPRLSKLHQHDILTLKELQVIFPYLCSLSNQERKEITGLNPNRSDIIISGAAILLKILTLTGHQEIRISRRGLIHGLVDDILISQSISPVARKALNRYHTIVNLGRKFHIDENHAFHVMNLSLMLFDSSREAGLHTLSDDYREILTFSAYLHDIGNAISYPRHHQHSHYIITRVSLAGFDPEEQRLIGLVTRYHRKKPPRGRDEMIMHLNREEIKVIKTLSLILRIAESLDNGHMMTVQSARFIRVCEKKVIVELCCNGDSTAEWMASREVISCFEKKFKKTIEFSYNLNQVRPPAAQVDLDRFHQTENNLNNYWLSA